MTFLKVLVLAVVCLAQLVGSCNNSAVKEFKDLDSFNTDLSSKAYVLVDYFATWCPHCVKLAPSFEAAAKIIQSRSIKDKVSLVKIKCNGAGKKICEDNYIQGYPSLKVYHKGKVLDEYFGPRNADGIVNYMEKIVKTGKAQFLGKPINTDQKICMAKSYRKYVSHKS